MRHDGWILKTELGGFAAMVLVVGLIGEPRALAPQQQQQQQQQNPPGQPPAGQRGGGGQRGRGGVQVLTLSTTAWTDGGTIPIKHSQAGRDVSPPLAWTEPQWTTPPQGETSFVLLVHDLDAVNSDGATTPLHWLVWNIPGSTRNLPEGVPHGGEMPGGSRQISQSGPYYRGPAAPATGPPHHYAFELYLIEGKIDVAAVGASPAATRTAVWAAMAGKIRGKATLTGTFRRN
jgi:Raf kinase inhibitor-like YbhB/YbcL family protein